MDKDLLDVVNRKNRDANLLDVIIRNGTIADGTGNPTYHADVAVKGDRIVDIGEFGNVRALYSIDASGMIVCPGFIDAHSHTDATILMNPTAESTIRQGITTEITGNCGSSFAPVTDLSKKSGAGTFGSFSGIETSCCSFGEFIGQIGKIGTSNNIAWQVGHNTLRSAVGLKGPNASDEQLKSMERLLDEAMETGAIGFSTGLEFEPGRSAPKEEIIRLAAVLKKYGAFYTSHIRNRDSHVQAAVEEFIDIIRYCGVRGQVSHFNIRYNTGAPEGAWHRAVEAIEAARGEGMDILSDMTPLTYGIGQMSAILPPWIRSGGTEKVAERMCDMSVRNRLKTDCDRYWRFIHRGEWDRIRMQSNPVYPEVNGMTFPEISKLWGKDTWDCYFDILSAAGQNMDGIVLVARLFTDEHLREAIRHPLFMLVTDGYSSKIDGSLARETAFPLHFMGMTRFLTHHVRECHTLTLEEAVRKMTGMPATHFGLRGRGFIREGFTADIAVFDFDKLEEVSTIEKPLAYVRGVGYVLVNGVPVIYKGVHTGARPGKNILRN